MASVTEAMEPTKVALVAAERTTKTLPTSPTVKAAVAQVTILVVWA